MSFSFEAYFWQSEYDFLIQTYSSESFPDQRNTLINRIGGDNRPVLFPYFAEQILLGNGLMVML